MDHYYSAHPHSPSVPAAISVHVRGQAFSLAVDAGVFSKSGLDYGTRLLIESANLDGCSAAVDLGCGYGVVSAALARAYPELQWWAVDINERAVKLARRNLSIFGERVRVVHSDGLAALALPKVDAVMLNPPIRAGKATVYRLFEEAASVLQDGGSLWIVIHKKHGAASARAKLATLFADVELRARDGGYHVFRCKFGARVTGDNDGDESVK